MFGKGAPRCRRCAGAVYSAEEVLGAGQKWHTECFSCLTCKTRLSSTTLTEKDGEIYCQTCYAKQWGPKGFGIGSQSLTYTGVSVSDAPGSRQSPPAARASPPAAAAAAAASSPQSGGAGRFCTNCGTGGQSGKFCGSCGKPVAGSGGAPASSAAASSAPAPVISPPAAAAAFSPNRGGIQRPAQVSVPTTSTKCGSCNTTVYEAEKVVGGGRVFHQACFRCAQCRAGLNSTNINDKEGKIFCNACYAKTYGPKGYGFSGGGAGMLSQ